MSGFYEPDRKARASVADPYGDMTGGPSFQTEQMPALIPVSAATGGAVDRAAADIVTAQRVAVKRDLPRILKEIDATAEVAAHNFYYQWPTKNKDGTTGIVEGPSIDCAMALINIWGNCRIEAFPATETQTHWVFMARFTDFEKGVTVIRSFQQRRSQRAGGKMDVERMEDIAFQIGQSKAMRNAIVAGLKVYADRAVRAAKASAYAWVEQNVDRAREVVLELATTLRVPVGRMERLQGRKADAWLAPDLIALRSKLLSIQDGFDDIDTAFPAEDEAEAPQQQAETGPAKAAAKPPAQQQEQPQTQQRQARKPKPEQEKPADKPADTKAPANDAEQKKTVQEQPQKPSDETKTAPDAAKQETDLPEQPEEQHPADGEFSDELRFE